MTRAVRVAVFALVLGLAALVAVAAGLPGPAAGLAAGALAFPVIVVLADRLDRR